MRWTPIMMVLSLFSFFFAVSLFGFGGFDVIARENQGLLMHSIKWGTCLIRTEPMLRVT